MATKPERVREFVALCDAEFGEVISEDEAVVMIAKCVGLLKLMAEDLPMLGETQEEVAEET